MPKTLYTDLILYPMTAPSSPVAGDIYFDSTANKPYYYSGSAWVAMSGGSQTPWASDIDASSYNLLNLGELDVGTSGTLGTSGMSNAVINADGSATFANGGLQILSNGEIDLDYGAGIYSTDGNLIFATMGAAAEPIASVFTSNAYGFSSKLSVSNGTSYASAVNAAGTFTDGTHSVDISDGTYAINAGGNFNITGQYMVNGVPLTSILPTDYITITNQMNANTYEVTGNAADSALNGMYLDGSGYLNLVSNNTGIIVDGGGSPYSNISFYNWNTGGLGHITGAFIQDGGDPSFMGSVYIFSTMYASSIGDVQSSTPIINLNGTGSGNIGMNDDGTGFFIANGNYGITWDTAGGGLGGSRLLLYDTGSIGNTITLDGGTGIILLCNTGGINISGAGANDIVTAQGSYKTLAPTATTATSVFKTTQYLSLQIGATTYKVALVV